MIRGDALRGVPSTAAAFPLSSASLTALTESFVKLPNAKNALISESKIRGYLLSLSHPVGQSKARFFRGRGFSVENWQLLADALGEIAVGNEVTGTEPSPFGMRYIIDGRLPTPDGRNPLVRTVWFIDTEKEIPHFVTAFPR